MGIGYQSSFEPLRLNPPIQLPSTGDLWKEVGRSALAAGQAIQNSAINPAVKEQMKYSQAQFQQGENQIAAMRANPYGWLLGRTTPQGYEGLSPAESGTAFAPFFQPKIPPPPGKEPPPAPKTAPGTGRETTEKTTQPSQPSTQPKDPNDLQIDTTSADTDTSGLTASTDTDALVRQMIRERQAAGLGGSEAAQPGTPPGLTFTNPATGNVQPLQQTAPGMFAGRAATPPAAAPSAPAQAQPPAQQPADQGSAISQITQQPGVALANWQNQNIHPVIAPPALQQALVDNVSTKFKNAHVTYQPGGGVNGEPSFGIDLKDGGHSTLSLSQLASTPWGRSLIQGQNAGQAMQAQVAPPQTNQPGNMLLQQQPGQQPGQPPTPIPSGTGAGAPQGPPPAPSVAQVMGPTPMPSGTGMGAPQGAPAAPGPQAYNPAAYQMPQGPTITQAGQLNPALMAGGDNEQALAAARAAAQPKSEVEPLTDEEQRYATPEAIAAARANAKLDPNQPTDAAGNPYMGELGPWHLYRNDIDKTNELYAVRSGLSSLYKQQRYILGSDGWHEYELPDTNTRLNVEGEFGGGKGSVVGAIIPDGKTINGKNTFPSLSHNAIVKMPVPQMQQLLELAGKYHNTTGDPNSTMQSRLSDLVDTSQRVQRMIDGNTVALNEGKSPLEYNRDSQYWSSEARERDKLQPAGGWTKFNILDPRTWAYGIGEEPNALQYMYHDQMARGTPVNKFSDYLEEQVKRMNDSMSQTPGRQAALVPTQQEKEGPSATVYGPWGTGVKLQGGSSDTSSQSRHMEVQKQFEARTPDDQKEAIKGLQRVKNEYDRQFKESYEDAVTHNFRLPPQATLYYNALTKGGKFPDKDNQFRDSNGQLVNPWPGSVRPSANPSPSSTPALPQISKYDTAEFDRLNIKKGDQYLGPDGKTIFTRGQ
jgi:hypothetical protein